ncbi:hypothetical protein CAEBREN_11953 [Caenorhabditis brenneri]|uniref:Uncharacterized protein n=1 Tax=Caenorhabditis brenneri TaxID=135651 RepID=G0M9V0_CAEBE|nr:hypothetical protein CAEBREN_11953 [Caenorhabditis brenneri]
MESKDPPIQMFFRNITFVIGLPAQGTFFPKNPYWEMITNIKDIDYFFGVMMAIYALYLGAGAVHFGYFKILKRKQMTPVSPLFYSFSQINQITLIMFQLLVLIFFLLSAIKYGFIIDLIVIFSTFLMALVRMFTEIYIICVCMMVIHRHIERFNSHNVKLIPFTWRNALKCSFLYVTFKDLFMVALSAILFCFNKNFEKLLSGFAGMVFPSQLLLALSAMCYFDLLCYKPWSTMSVSEFFLGSQTVSITVMKVLIYFLAFCLRHTDVGSGVVSAILIFSDVLIVPLIILLTDIMLYKDMKVASAVEEEINLMDTA